LIAQAKRSLDDLFFSIGSKQLGIKPDYLKVVQAGADLDLKQLGILINTNRFGYSCSVQAMIPKVTIL
jgi:hypothetical protein